MKSRAILFLGLAISTLACHAQARSASQAPVTPDAAAGSAAGASNDTYIIEPSDMLTVSVWKQPNLSGALLVRPDGKISMPLLGDIEASGATPMRLAARISDKLKKFITDPDVSVVVSQIHKSYVYVLGEVGKRGPVEMAPDMTFLQAISSAGGLTDFAKKSKIYILRKTGGKDQRIPLQYKKALEGDARYNPTLVPGDTIVVP
jgi:polysaccharide biosynthesis/export protein